MKLSESIPHFHVATPCQADWHQMDGDERARFCGQCRKHVYNLSAMSASAAAQLIREKEGKLCVRFYRRADGTVLHGEDCPVGLAARQWRKIRHGVSALCSLVLMALGLGRAQAQPTMGTPAAKPTPTPPGREIMGDYCPAPSPTPKPNPTPSR